MFRPLLDKSFDPQAGLPPNTLVYCFKMQDQFAITVSDTYGSRYYSINKSVKRNLILAIVGVFLIMAGSLVVNFFQLHKGRLLSDQNQKLDAEVLRFDSDNSKLNQTISKKSQLIEKISEELVEIEQMSAVETADQQLGLDERIRLIANFYNAKEQEFSEIDSRVQQIEGLIGLSEQGPEQNDLITRVELASLTASHEKILHDSIPNGYPTVSNIVTSKFGTRIHPVTNIKSLHKGVDLRAKPKDKVFVTADGIVRDVSYTELSGNRIVVQHNYGFETSYSHLNRSGVEPGDIVHKGDLIAFSGNTGRSDGPHLHYEIRYLGKSIDPHQFLIWEFGSHEIFTNVRGIKWPSLISLINKQITHQTLQLSQLEPTSSVK